MAEAKRRTPLWAWGALVAGGLGLGAVGGLIAGGLAGPGQAPAVDGAGPVEQGPTAGDNPYAGFRVAGFTLIDQNGETVSESVFDGRVTALTFFFTSCNGPCPDMTRAMRGIQDRTEGDSVAQGLRLASISVDGSRDTPAIIRGFADAYGADLTRWTFMTGSPEIVRRLAADSIGFELREQAVNQIPGPSGEAMNNILHPTRILLVGPDRRLIGVYWYNDGAQIDRLIEDARAALG